jgi:DNA-binding transcriptional LysR family regulator
MFDWDDLKVFIAAARAGSLGGASERLGIDPATVGRRVARLETSFKATLVARTSTGLQLTAAGAQLFRKALEAETAILSAESVTQSDLVAGTVRMSAAEGFGTRILAPALPSLTRARPGLRIELAAHAGFLSPSRREVDMAITLSVPEAHRLVVEPLTHYQLALYASPNYLEKHGRPGTIEDLRRFEIVGYIDDLLYAPELRYLDEILPGLMPTLSSSSIRAQQAMITAGAGIGVLPCFLAEGLEQVLGKNVGIVRRFWLSTHRDVHETARLRAVTRWLKDYIQKCQPLLCPQPKLIELADAKAAGSVQK